MKKLMIVAAAALCAAVGFAEGIESSNVVGYTNNATKDLNNFVTVPFGLIGYNTCDIQQIRISDGGEGNIGWGFESFAVWEGLPTVVEGSGFFYTDPSMSATGEDTDYFWGDDVGNRANYSFVPGQGIVINCPADLTVSMAGEVPSQKVEFTSIDLNNFTGNPFPAPIDIQAIKISDGGAGDIGWGFESFAVWEGLPTVVEGSGFFYTDPSMSATGEETDYFWGDDVGNKAEFKINPGQGIVLNLPAGLTVTIEPPYTLGE